MVGSKEQSISAKFVFLWVTIVSFLYGLFSACISYINFLNTETVRREMVDPVSLGIFGSSLKDTILDKLSHYHQVGFENALIYGTIFILALVSYLLAKKVKLDDNDLTRFWVVIVIIVLMGLPFIRMFNL